MEIKCQLYKPTGKWYGDHTIYLEQPRLFFNITDEFIISECSKGYTNPSTFIIHVQSGYNSRLILPS